MNNTITKKKRRIKGIDIDEGQMYSVETLVLKKRVIFRLKNITHAAKIGDHIFGRCK